MRVLGALKTIGFLIATPIIFIGLIVFSVWADELDWDNPSDYARITEVDYRAIVVDEPGSNGKVVITEVLTFDIHSASRSNPFRELWRDLPEEYIDGVLVEYNVLSVKQVFNDGRRPVVFEQAPKLYWDDDDFVNTARGLGPGKWYHSPGPYNNRTNFECLLIYVDIYRETVYFEIEYEMFNASMRWSDSSELYLSMYSEETIRHLRSFKGQVLFPIDIMPRPQYFEAYTFGTNSNGFPFTESTAKNPGYNTFAFELDKSQLRFRPYNQYIEFLLIAFGEDRHIFTQHASVNDYFNDTALYELREELAEYLALPGIFRIVKIVVLIVFSAGAVLVIFLVFRADKKTKEKHTYYQPSMQMDYFRDIPSELDPHFAAILVFCKHKRTDDALDGYSAVMLDLVRKGYIELDRISTFKEWVSDNVKIIVKYNPDEVTSYCAGCGAPATVEEKFCSGCGTTVNENPAIRRLKPLTATEELYFNLILKYAKYKEDGISVDLFQKMVTEDEEHTDYFLARIKHAITGVGINKGYFQKAEYKEPANKKRKRATTLIWIGALIMLLGNLISYQTRLDLAFGAFTILGLAFIAGAVFLKIMAKNYVLLTQFGEDEYAKWRGLYNFLKSETLMKERTVIDVVIWEQYLVYATAFGISEKVIKALQLRCSEASLNSSPVLRNRYCRSRGFYNSGRSFSRSSRSASASFRSGGGGGGSGYGGGGRGGGGGGGGH